MFEIWTYSVSPAEDKVYYAVWGGGVLEYDVKTEHWKDYNDPDGETELVLMKDQGLIHEITTSVSYVDKILWVATYFGASRYDGRYWNNFLQKDSGLPSNFSTRSKPSTRIVPGSRLTKVLPITTGRTGRSTVRRSTRTSLKCWCATQPAP